MNILFRKNKEQIDISNNNIRNNKINELSNKIKKNVYKILFLVSSLLGISDLEAKQINHKVWKWENLYRISLKYNISEKEIFDLNNNRKFWNHNVIEKTSNWWYKIFFWSEIIIKKDSEENQKWWYHKNKNLSFGNKLDKNQDNNKKIDLNNKNKKIDLIIKETLNFAKNSEKNHWYIHDAKYIKILEKRLYQTKETFLKLSNDKIKQNNFIKEKINKLKENIDYHVDFSKENIDLFYYYCDLERIQVQREYFLKLSWSDFYDFHVKKYWWNWEEAVKQIISSLKLKEDFKFIKTNAIKYKKIIDINYKKILSKTSIKIENIYWKIQRESLFNPLNINSNWIWWVWIWMNTLYIYWWKDKVSKNEKNKYIFNTYTNPFNPEENIKRSFEYLAFLYEKFKEYKNKPWYDIEMIIFTAYNFWHNRIKKIIKEKWINWHNNIKNEIARNYYRNIKNDWKIITNFYKEKWI